MLASGDSFHVLSQVPGRVRLHVPFCMEESGKCIKDRLERIKGTQRVQINPLTGNVLVNFDPKLVSPDTLLTKLIDILEQLRSEESPVSSSRSTPQRDSGYSPGRVVVRGLLGHAFVDSLWFGAGFVGSAMGLPLAGLGPLHVLVDIAVWMTALSGESDLFGVPSVKQRPGLSTDVSTARQTLMADGKEGRILPEWITTTT